MRVPKLHMASKRHLIKIRTTLRKKSNKTPKKFSTDQLKITFEHQNFVRKPFQICSKIHISLDFKHLNFRIFSFILHHKYPNNLF